MCAEADQRAAAITMPAIISRRGPKRSTIQPAANPNSGPTTAC